MFSQSLFQYASLLHLGQAVILQSYPANEEIYLLNMTSFL